MALRDRQIDIEAETPATSPTSIAIDVAFEKLKPEVLANLRNYE
jgi:hypothetical protein